ncbi:hypothetical protein EUX98_g2102 [Antrodiella citrinella]|uniref:Uncharacterized protein n=1 Tax=Antrodiella citrinella TaxID=2447956 RepID=A0A4S4MZS7_9APHY|nr:hypothetical protein EUX98_g2102 [Antrodiella citrinella]
MLLSRILAPQQPHSSFGVPAPYHHPQFTYPDINYNVSCKSPFAASPKRDFWGQPILSVNWLDVDNAMSQNNNDASTISYAHVQQRETTTTTTVATNSGNTFPGLALAADTGNARAQHQKQTDYGESGASFPPPPDVGKVDFFGYPIQCDTNVVVWDVSVSRNDAPVGEDGRRVEDNLNVALQCAENVLAPAGNAFHFGGFDVSPAHAPPASDPDPCWAPGSNLRGIKRVQTSSQPLPVMPMPGGNKHQYTSELISDDDEVLAANWRMKQEVKRNNHLQLLENLVEDAASLIPIPIPVASPYIAAPIPIRPVHINLLELDAAPARRTKQKYAHLRDRVIPPRALDMTLCDVQMEKERDAFGPRIEIIVGEVDRSASSPSSSSSSSSDDFSSSDTTSSNEIERRTPSDSEQSLTSHPTEVSDLAVCFAQKSKIGCHRVPKVENCVGTRSSSSASVDPIAEGFPKVFKGKPLVGRFAKFRHSVVRWL